jgi:hypothetical protein
MTHALLVCILLPILLGYRAFRVGLRVFFLMLLCAVALIAA